MRHCFKAFGPHICADVRNIFKADAFADLIQIDLLRLDQKLVIQDGGPLHGLFMSFLCSKSLWKTSEDMEATVHLVICI